MNRGLVSTFAAFAVLASACAQTVPDAVVLPPVPEGTLFPVTTTLFPPAESTLPNDGSCYLVESTGARVLSTEETYDVSRVLEPGDVITGIDARPVSSEETLFAALAGTLPGDTIEVLFTRAGEMRSASVVLRSPPATPGLVTLGVTVEPALTARSRGDIAAPAPAGSHLLVVDDEVFRVDVVGGSWHSTGVVGVSELPIVLDGEVYAPPLDGTSTLRPLSRDTSSLTIPTQDWRLVGAYTRIDDTVLALVEIPVPDNPGVETPVLIATNVAIGEVEWVWLPVDETLGVGVPVGAFASPDGQQIVVPVATGQEFHHTLLDRTGSVVAGFGSTEPLLPVDVRFAGWFGPGVVAFTARGEELVVVVQNLQTGRRFAAVSLPLDEGPQVWTVGDGQHLVTVTSGQARVYDALSGQPGRPLTHTCGDTFILGGPFG